MNRLRGLILAALAVALAAPTVAEAQQGSRPSNNVWTRSATLYLDRATRNPRPEEQRALWEQALEQSLLGTQNDPGNPNVWRLAGTAYVRLGDFVRADSMFRRAEALWSPYEEVARERSNAWVTAFNAGIANVGQNNFEAAIAQMQRAHVIYDQRPEAQLQLGSLYARTGEADKAVDAFRGALVVLRGPGRENLGARNEARWREFEEIAAFNLAQILATEGRDAEAIEAFTDFLAREPDNVTAKQNLAVVLTRAGRADEAARIYTELLARGDLQDRDYMAIGLGLFRAEQFDRAEDAFAKALELNPYLRDARFNQSQSIYARAVALERERETARGADATRLKDELRGLYEELRVASEALLELDPLNRNTMLLLARAHRGLADVAVNDRTADAARAKSLEVLRREDATAFFVTDLEVRPADEEAVTIRGKVQNAKAPAGQPVQITFTLLNKAGAPVAEEAVTVPAPAAEETAAFEATVKPSGEVAGWRYRVR
jgi:tetratricopeptide (TPR) repeat protein